MEKRVFFQNLFSQFSRGNSEKKASAVGGLGVNPPKAPKREE